MKKKLPFLFSSLLLVLGVAGTAAAIPPPDIIVSAGSQLPHLFYLLLFGVTSLLGVGWGFFRLYRCRILLGGVVLVVVGISLWAYYYKMGML